MLYRTVWVEASRSESHYGCNVRHYSFRIWIHNRPFIGLGQNFTISFLYPFSFSIALKYDYRFLL
ncbi:hypothetical protein PT2222_180132 [Paraburkholderia tropica]